VLSYKDISFVKHQLTSINKYMGNFAIVQIVNLVSLFMFI